jgi:hypothetical protein
VTRRNSALCALVSLVLIAAAPVSLPRTPDGHPDLQGIWANDTVTMLERPGRFGNKAVFTATADHEPAGRWKDRFGDLERRHGELSPVQEHGTMLPTPGARQSSTLRRQGALKPDVRARAQARPRAPAHPADDGSARSTGAA